ncbi:PREDICTED: uncharacterized protein LOC109172180 [Ipomoea nil]|uniref:uncharacterized protein LOC109172180 n=1 Tax=Ipomoea nil TaxID=35883 RepID=UPI0009011ACA|nr:PREDICTED: uncharacterized protein LOC109172180 [Ipomoea nil]
MASCSSQVPSHKVSFLGLVSSPRTQIIEELHGSQKKHASEILLRLLMISFLMSLIESMLTYRAKIEEGFGPNNLGILSISDVPEYTLLRPNLLLLSPRLANLPKSVKQELEDPHSRYNFGWSRGKEKLESGKPDTLKGSSYANPVFDVPTTEKSLIERYSSYCGRNIWPHRALRELEMG